MSGLARGKSNSPTSQYPMSAITMIWSRSLLPAVGAVRKDSSALVLVDCSQGMSLNVCTPQLSLAVCLAKHASNPGQLHQLC